MADFRSSSAAEAFLREVRLFSSIIPAAQMPRNNELKKILLIGSGPIVIGQGCEFDYSGCKPAKPCAKRATAWCW
jgi:hypothetical protein